MHPNGMPACTGSVVAQSDRSLASLQDAILLGRIFRWYRCAQPPANRCDASGIQSVSFNKPVSQRLAHLPSPRGSFHRGFFTSQNSLFYLPTENSEEPKFRPHFCLKAVLQSLLDAGFGAWRERTRTLLKLMNSTPKAQYKYQRRVCITKPAHTAHRVVSDTNTVAAVGRGALARFSGREDAAVTPPRYGSECDPCARR